MQQILFPNWLLFAGFYLFLRIFNPTRLYLDNTSSLAIAIMLAIGLESEHLAQPATLLWVMATVTFAFVCSVPYWLSGMVGGVLQQMLLLNEQSVQDHRFTEESEALAKLCSLVFVAYALENGAVFKPLLDLIVSHHMAQVEISFATLYQTVVGHMQMIFIITGKYIILLLVITMCCGYLDLYFKKASLSLFVTSNIKSIVIVILLNIWLFHDQFYVFNKMMQSLGYD
ncbi:type III secretion system apparatus protein VscT2 [Vibrio cholerae]|nr:type III secretion system apparatus protein VscT2 [Vibrio cholerae]EGR5734023.1 type III secretion system apparatus protein VscT2 [Vibrio cholerae]EHD7114015.1 type III secretion system apparatus protein VscT2 [Vibrio cholerae]EJF0911139.1 type III secretion system apparatus protein VscT2 [Vibrio cholerae]EJL6521057.1 type III secretion system apparatus protein VscT2 [Vibrio cholerae]